VGGDGTVTVGGGVGMLVNPVIGRNVSIPEAFNL
jgi:hypothetical protein